MNAPARLAAFGVAAAVAFGVGFGIGNMAGPFEDEPTHQTPDVGDVHDQHGSGEGQE